MSIPVFIDLEPNSQLGELRAFMKSKNIEIEESGDDLSLEDNLSEVIKASEQLWKEVGHEPELEMIFNSIISLVIVLPVEKIGSMTLSLCKQLGRPHPGVDKRNISKLRLLNHLFVGLEETCHLRCDVYLSFLKLASQTEMLHLLNIKLEDIRIWVKQWQIKVSEYQALLRVLHEVFINAKQSDKASMVMIELLGTYDEDSAAQAREDARRCIATCIADPSVLLLDHLLLLKPVKFLEGETIHDLVTIFVTGKLSQYMDFYAKHKDVIESNGLNHENNTKKMRLLTFLALAEVSRELLYETIEAELLLSPGEVEPFIIQVIKSKAAQVKIMQTQKKIVVNSAMKRTFGRGQWAQLKDKLSLWRSKFVNMGDQMMSISV